jgi:hypothetical protein
MTILSASTLFSLPVQTTKLPTYSTERFYCLSNLETLSSLHELEFSSSSLLGKKVLYHLHDLDSNAAVNTEKLVSSINLTQPAHLYVDCITTTSTHENAVKLAQKYIESLKVCVSKGVTSQTPLLSLNVGVSTNKVVAPALATLSDIIEKPSSNGSDKLSVYGARKDFMGLDEKQETDAVEGVQQSLLSLGTPPSSSRSGERGVKEGGTSSEEQKRANHVANFLIFLLVVFIANRVVLNFEFKLTEDW